MNFKQHFRLFKDERTIKRLRAQGAPQKNDGIFDKATFLLHLSL